MSILMVILMVNMLQIVQKYSLLQAESDTLYTSKFSNTFNSEFSNCMAEVEMNNDTYKLLEVTETESLKCDLFNDILRNCQDSGLKDNNYSIFQSLIDTICQAATKEQQQQNVNDILQICNDDACDSDQHLDKRLLDPKYLDIDFDEYYNQNNQKSPKAMTYDCNLMQAIKSTQTVEDNVMTIFTSTFTVSNPSEVSLTVVEFIKVISIPQPSL
ncbi:uncharacterized protein RJT21DRAFT_140591 [Scheffersomyces amazonensis]|uniref:uncharacterized protein n=1 Tax=Scheffersomyces amazonensis TaxID=1078765 RepID=UPI00315D6A17